MIIFRNSAPRIYNPYYSVHLRPNMSLDYGQPKVFLWHSSPATSSATEHVDKKHKNDELTTPQAQQVTCAASKKDDCSSPVVFHDRNAHVVDTNDALIMSVDLPGVTSTSNDVTIDVEGGVLSIAAERQSRGGHVTKQKQQFLINELKVDPGKLEANLTDGVLTITLPKKPETQPIAISVAAQSPPEGKNGEEDAVLQFTVDLPGVKVNDIQLELHEQTVTLQATRSRGGHTSSTIHKQFFVDPSKIDTESVKAYLADGVLTIVGTRKEIPKKTVSVSCGTASVSVSPSPKSIENKDDDLVIVETVNEDENKNG